MRNFLVILLLFAAGVGTYGYFKNPVRFARWGGDLQTKLLALMGSPASPVDQAAPAKAPDVAAGPEWTPPAIIPSEPNWTWTTPDKIYTNVVISKIEADRVTIFHADGRAVLPIWTLPADIQRLLNYDPAAAAAAIALREHPPAAAEPSPPDAVAAGTQAPPAEKDVYQEALATARLSGKPVLLHFDGSTYCPPCQLLDREVFSTGAFQSYVEANFILLTLDYTNPTTPDRVKDGVHEKYHIQGVPTLVVIDAKEKELGRLLGYGPGLGENWVEDQLDAIVNKASGSATPSMGSINDPVGTLEPKGRGGR